MNSISAVRNAIKAIPAEFVIRDFLLAQRVEEDGMIGAIVILRGLGLDDAAIIEKIMVQYNLTLDEAKKYF